MPKCISCNEEKEELNANNVCPDCEEEIEEVIQNVENTNTNNSNDDKSVDNSSTPDLQTQVKERNKLAETAKQELTPPPLEEEEKKESSIFKKFGFTIGIGCICLACLGIYHTRKEPKQEQNPQIS
ncbi:MAG: hypothetical protein C0626_02055 [Arcobacter sp.]|uniref:hypothetical protein n=1 Tax=uncultured Arcobacter sp. TaxID=165434 RepID=UPI000CB6D148|nr:hypothetical protein [uncultured Arcobacter sp.]PLY11375.1 MAG: hypothetical protein C0626_02055 [Arcobacter sp.]